MGFARKLGFCLKPTGPVGKLFPVKSDPMKAALIFVPFIMNSSLFSIKKRLLIYKNSYKNVPLQYKCYHTLQSEH